MVIQNNHKMPKFKYELLHENQHDVSPTHQDGIDCSIVPTDDEGVNDDEKFEEENKQSLCQTTWSILNLIQGAGTLAVPYAIAMSGYLLIPFIVVYGALMAYTSNLLIECQYDNVEDDEEDQAILKRRRGYKAIGNISFIVAYVAFLCAQAGSAQHVWGLEKSAIVSVVQMFHLIGACVLYLLMVSSFVNELWSDVLKTKQVCVLVSGCLLLPTIFIKSVKQVSWLNFMSIIVIDVVFVVAIVSTVVQGGDWKPSQIPYVNFKFLPSGLGVIAFSFVAHPYLPSIEDGMTEPQKFPKIVSISFSASVVIKMIFGVVMATKNGGDTAQLVTNNIQPPILNNIVSGCLALVGYYSFPMPCIVISNIIRSFDSELMERLSERNEYIIQTILQAIILIMVVIIASIVPDFALILAVFGSCTAVLLSIIFPLHFYNSLKVSSSTANSHSIIIIFGIVTGILGFGSSLWKLSQTY